MAYMVMDPETKRKIKDYILKEYNKGYTYNAIEKVLINSGYDKADVEKLVREIVREPIKSRLIKGLPFLILSLIIIFGVILFVIFGLPKLSISECDTKDCFIKNANDCKASKFIVNDDGTLYEFITSGDCTLTKTITKVSSSEPEAIRDLFMDKSLVCQYEKSDFDDKWISTLLGGLEKCTGSLKEALYELTIAQYKQEVSI